MDSTEILINNLKQYYCTNSLHVLSKKINISVNVILNWSSKRSSPNVEQVDQIAYLLGFDTYQLLIPNNVLNIETPIWRDRLKDNLKENMGRLKNENDIHESSFYKDNLSNDQMTYRNFLRYVNGKYKILNLKNLDVLAQILSVETYQLLKGECE